MRRARRGKLLPLVGALCLLLLGLTGCSQEGKGNSAQSTRGLRLQILTTDASPGGSVRRVVTPEPVRRVTSGDPGFITRLDIRVEATDMTTITRSVSLTAEQQQEVTVEILVPVGSNRRVLVSAVNASEVKIFQGEVTVNIPPAVEPVLLTMARILIPTDASAADLADKSFAFADGTVVGVTGAVTLAFGPFVGTQGVFTLTSGSSTASGSVTILTGTATSAHRQAAAEGQTRQTPSGPLCVFAVETSNYPAPGPQRGDLFPAFCQVDAVDGRLIVLVVDENTEIRLQSSPPVGVPVSTTFPFLLDVGRLDSARERLQ